MTNAPGMYSRAVALSSSEKGIFALRDDGAVFVLLRRGDQLTSGEVVQDPVWIQAPAVPGTIAHYEQEG